MVAVARERRAGEARGRRRAALRRGPCLRGRGARLAGAHPSAFSHIAAWGGRRAGADLQRFCIRLRRRRRSRDRGEAARGMDDFDVAIVVNPNNPDGRITPRAALLDLHERLARRGGVLIVDEAFADFDAEGESLAPVAAHEQRGRPALVRQGLRTGRAAARFCARLARHRPVLAGRPRPVAGQRAGDCDRGSRARRFGLARGDARAPWQGGGAARRSPARRRLANHRRDAPFSTGRARRRARRLRAAAGRRNSRPPFRRRSRLAAIRDSGRRERMGTARHGAARVSRIAPRAVLLAFPRAPHKRRAWPIARRESSRFPPGRRFCRP